MHVAQLSLTCVLLFFLYITSVPGGSGIEKAMGGPTYPRVLLGVCGEGVWNTQILILYFNQLQYEDYDYYCIVFILLEYTR
jgi:hypothetical protein